MARTFPRVGDTKFDILALLVDHERESTKGLSFDEIRERVGLGFRSSVHWHVKDLAELGLVSSIPGRRRSLKPTDRGRKLVRILRELGEGGDETAGQGQQPGERMGQQSGR